MDSDRKGTQRALLGCGIDLENGHMGVLNRRFKECLCTFHTMEYYTEMKKKKTITDVDNNLDEPQRNYAK